MSANLEYRTLIPSVFVQTGIKVWSGVMPPGEGGMFQVMTNRKSLFIPSIYPARLGGMRWYETSQHFKFQTSHLRKQSDMRKVRAKR